MTEQARKYLSDILLAIDLIEEFLIDTNSYSEYCADSKTKSAVERQLAIIGEAVNHAIKVKPDLLINHARQLVNFRNRLIHSYDNIDDSIVWTIIERHLPNLKKEVEVRLKE